jgi:ubiquinone/menaquinone biosynthesis C-methylase UbiE
MLYKDKRTYPRIYGLGNKPLALWLRARLALQKFNTKLWYYTLSLLAQDDVIFLNYGYATTDSGGTTLELEAADEANRYPIQLYNRVASAVDLRGKDVLEVGSGRGGGAAFIQKYMHLRSMTGVDFCGKAVKFCRRRHGHEKLSFIHGDAENLPFPAEFFDAVVNLESCHCYTSVTRFLTQAARVLRSGGHLLFADVGPKPYIDTLRGHIAQSGLSIEEEEDITPAVSCALGITSEQNRKKIQEQVPVGLRSIFRNFAGIRDTPVFEACGAGEWVYIRFVLKKAAS